MNIDPLFYALVVIDVVLYWGFQYTSNGRGLFWPPMLWLPAVFGLVAHFAALLATGHSTILEDAASRLTPRFYQGVLFLFVCEFFAVIIYHLFPVKQKRYRVQITVYGRMLDQAEFAKSFCYLDDAKNYAYQQLSDPKVVNAKVYDNDLMEKIRL